VDKKLNHVICAYTHKTNTQSLNIVKKRTSNKIALVKFIFNVWESEIVSTLPKVHDTGWPGFDGK